MQLLWVINIIKHDPYMMWYFGSVFILPACCLLAGDVNAVSFAERYFESISDKPAMDLNRLFRCESYVTIYPSSQIQNIVIIIQYSSSIDLWSAAMLHTGKTQRGWESSRLQTRRNNCLPVQCPNFHTVEWQRPGSRTPEYSEEKYWPR